MDQAAANLWSSQGLTITVTGPGFSAGGEVRALNRPFARIGRASNNDLLLDSDDVSRWHLYLHRTDEGVAFIDLGSRTGLRLDGETKSRGWLPGEKWLRIGPYSLKVDGPNVFPDRDPFKRRLSQTQNPAALRFTGRTGKMVDQPLERELTLLGRDHPSTLRLPDEHIARTHLLLYRNDDGLWIVNLAGVHVYCDNHRVDAVRLHDGQRFRLGKYYLVDVLLGEGAAPADTVDDSQQLTQESSDADLQSQLTELGETLESLRRERDELARLQSESNKERQGVAAERDRLETRLNETAEELASQAEVVQKLQNQLTETETQLEGLRQQAEETARSRHCEEGIVADLKEQLRQITEALESQLRMAEESSLSLQERENQARRYAEDAERQARTVAELTSKLQEADKERQSLDDRCEKLQESLRLAEEEIQRFGSLEAERDEQNQQVARLRQERDKAVEKNEALVEQQAELTAQRDRQADEIKKLQESLDALRTESESAAARQAAEQADRIGRLEQRLQQTQEDFQAREDEWNQERQKAQQRQREEQAAESAVAEACKRREEELNASLKRRIETSEKRIGMLTEECGRLEEQNQTFDQTRQALSRRLAEIDELFDAKLNEQRRTPSAGRPDSKQAPTDADPRGLAEENSRLRQSFEAAKVELDDSRRQVEELSERIEKLAGQTVADDYFAFLSHRREK